MSTSTHLLLSFHVLRNHSDCSCVFLFLEIKSHGILVTLFDLQNITASGSSCLKCKNFEDSCDGNYTDFSPLETLC